MPSPAQGHLSCFVHMILTIAYEGRGMVPTASQVGSGLEKFRKLPRSHSLYLNSSPPLPKGQALNAYTVLRKAMRGFVTQRQVSAMQSWLKMQAVPSSCQQAIYGVNTG